MTFIIEKVANMIFINSGETIFRAWDEREFTERKLSNAIKKISDNYPGKGRCEFIRKF